MRSVSAATAKALDSAALWRKFFAIIADQEMTDG
jgi:hypothetical protein